jgi:hypothetical protein
MKYQRQDWGKVIVRINTSLGLEDVFGVPKEVCEPSSWPRMVVRFMFHDGHFTTEEKPGWLLDNA